MSPDASHQAFSTCHWLDDSNCEYILPSPSSSYGDAVLSMPPTCLLSSTSGWNSYYGNLYPSSSSPTCSDWTLSGRLSWGQDSLAGETLYGPVWPLPVCQKKSHVVVGVLAQSSASVWAVGQVAPLCGGETPVVITSATSAAFNRRPATDPCWDQREEL